jgi:hypothetical protein
MKYRDVLIPKTARDLVGLISVGMLYAPQRKEFEGVDFDGFFFSLERGVENLRSRFGDVKADQLLDMMHQAKSHYEAGGAHKPGTQANSENRLAGALMEDTKMLVMDRQAWAYPKELYRWSANPWLPEISEADLLSKDDEGD